MDIMGGEILWILWKLQSLFSWIVFSHWWLVGPEYCCRYWYHMFSHVGAPKMSCTQNIVKPKLSIPDLAIKTATITIHCVCMAASHQRNVRHACCSRHFSFAGKYLDAAVSTGHVPSFYSTLPKKWSLVCGGPAVIRWQGIVLVICGKDDKWASSR